MAVLEMIIPDDLQPMRLDKYLLRALPGLPHWAIREAFSRRDVKMDGVRVQAQAHIRPGAKVLVYGIKDSVVPELEVVYEDEHILLINKPAGISVQADSGGGITVEELAFVHVKKAAPHAMPPKACHRLDNQTSGLLLLTKTAEADKIMYNAFKERTMKKRYTCLVQGIPNPDAAVLQAYLTKDAKAAKVQVYDKPVPGALPITTGYRIIEKGEVSRLEVDLVTGRTHQIRAHLAHIGHPIIGDDAYGDRELNKKMNRKRLMLCAVSITIVADGVLSYLNGQTFTILPPF